MKRIGLPNFSIPFFSIPSSIVHLFFVNRKNSVKTKSTTIKCKHSEYHFIGLQKEAVNESVWFQFKKGNSESSYASGNGHIFCYRIDITAIDAYVLNLIELNGKFIWMSYNSGLWSFSNLQCNKLDGRRCSTNQCRHNIFNYLNAFSNVSACKLNTRYAVNKEANETELVCTSTNPLTINVRPSQSPPSAMFCICNTHTRPPSQLYGSSLTKHHDDFYVVHKIKFSTHHDKIRMASVCV